MQNPPQALPAGSEARPSAEATLLSAPPPWMRGAGPVLAALILFGLISRQRLITGIATTLMLLLIGVAILHLTVWRRRITVALSADALYVIERDRAQRYPLTSLVSVNEAEAKMGPNTAHVEFAGQDTLSFTWTASAQTRTIISALRRAREA